METSKFDASDNESKDVICGGTLSSTYDMESVSVGTTIGSQTITGCSTHYPSYQYSDPNLQAISNVCVKISSMCDTLNSLSRIYKCIDAHCDDVFITLASTGEVLSLNQLIKDSQELKRLKSSGEKVRKSQECFFH